MALIEKNVPPPTNSLKKYPFKDMEVGDSVVFPYKDAVTIRSCVYYYKSRYGKKFTVRKINDELRVWRIE